MKKSLVFLGSLLSIGALAGCNQTTPHEHTFKTEFAHDETNHWHKASCEHTDLISGLEAHNFSDDNVCNDCGYTKPTPVVPHEHSFTSAWSKDETNHWHAATCEHTTLVSGLAAHNYGDDNVCDDCHYEKPAPAHVHTYDLEHWETTSTHHWHTSTCEHTGLASNLGEHTYNNDGKCTVCGYKKELEHYSFLLRSDYCELDNENIYEEGEEVELSLTIKDEFKVSSTLPENIEVYSKGVLLTKGTDYTYAIEGETGKLSLTVKGDIVVIAFKDKNPDLFKITETQFADAMNVSDESHLQYNLTAGFYSSFSIVMQQYGVEYSPNVTYRGSYSIDASRNGGSINCDYTYIEKENEAYTEYHSDKSGVWTTRTTDEGTFNGMKSLSLGWFPFISGFQLTYDRIKDNFNSATNAYEVYFTYQEYDVKFEVTFYNGKLIDISYEGTYETDRGIFGNITVSYLEKDVSIPNEAKPHEHTFSEIWSIDETNHWHAATCEHSDLTKDLAAHDYGDDNICDDCGYELIVAQHHIVYFDSNGGSTVQPELVVDGGKITIPAEPAKENYVFLGWYESKEYTGNTYDFNQEITENTTLYALWGAKILYVNYDGVTYHEENVRLNTKINEPENPSWGEAHFVGWYESTVFEGTTFDFDLGVNKNTTLYARYGYALELVGLNGKIIASTLQPVDEVVSNPSDTSLDYYDFDNYYSDSEYTQLFEFGKKLTKDTKIYLKFIPKTYNITYSGTDITNNLNPTSYVYGVGLNSLLEPSVQDRRKFCGWYFDENYTQPATSIPSDFHGDITLYGKVAISHTITYNGWPKTIVNPNPTEVTCDDLIILDKSPLEAIEGITNVKFMILGEEAPSTGFHIDGDTVVDVEFLSSKTNVTFDLNGGKILPATPYIYIDGPLKGGKKKIEIANNDGTFNLYDSSILDKLESTYGGEGLFLGYFKDNEQKEPLSEEEINYIENGTTIYAAFTNIHLEGQTKKLPLHETGGWGEDEPASSIKELNYFVMVPKGCKRMNISFTVDATGDSTVLLADNTNTMSKIKSWSGAGNFNITETVNVEGMTKLNFQYTYQGSKSTFNSYSLSLTCGAPDDCKVQCIPTKETVTGEFTFYKTPEIPYSVIEKEDHTFMGWLDENCNLVDLTSDWIISSSACTLKARWKYNDMQSYIDNLAKYIEEQMEFVANCDALDTKIYSLRSTGLLNLAKEDLLENIYSKDEADAAYEYYYIKLTDMFMNDARYDLSGALLDLLNSYKEQIVGYDMEIGWLDEIYNNYVEFMRDSPMLFTIIETYNSGVQQLNGKFAYIIEHISI